MGTYIFLQAYFVTLKCLDFVSLEDVCPCDDK